MKNSATRTKPSQRVKSMPKHDRYFLRDLHREIDLYDRKLAYVNNFAEFATTADRDEAEKGLRAKRAPLERTALELVASGVEFEEKDLPRSFHGMNLDPTGARKNVVVLKRA